MIMGDLELIGKIIAQRYYFDADFAEAEKIEHLSDTAVMSSDNQMFTGHKVMIESRWYDAPIYSTSATEFQMDLQIPAALVSLLINFLHFRPVIFPSLDEALDLFSFAFKISNQQLQKLCLDGIKEKMSPLDVLKVWNHSKPLRKHKVIIEYVTYHFPLIFGESEAVQNEFKAMPLNDAVQLLKLRKLNIQSEKDLVPFIMFYIQQNLGEKVDQNDLLKTVNAFMECFRIQKDRAKYVLPYLMDFNNINGVVIDCKVPSFNSLRRIPRDLFIFYGLYNKRNPIAYYIDLDAKKLCRMSTLDNSDYSIAVPNFCIANGILYQIGGSTSPSPSGFPKADCFAFDKHGLKWKRKSSILHERAYSNVCSAPNGSIFVVGGHSFTLRSRMKNVDIYDPIKNTWKSLPKMLNGRYHAGSIFYGGNLYVTGGSAEEHALGDCEYLPKYSEHWVIMPQLNRARSGHQTVVYGQYLYVLGGRNVNEELSSVERLELGTNGTWREVAPMSFKRANFAAAVWDNKLFVFGGERDNLTQTVEYFDGENWHPFCSLPADLTPLAAMNWKNVSFADRLLKNDGIDSMIFATLDEEEDEEICSNNNCCMDGGAIQGA